MIDRGCRRRSLVVAAPSGAKPAERLVPADVARAFDVSRTNARGIFSMGNDDA